jgi:hypothetical protein
MENFKKSTREERKNKLKDKNNKFYGSQKHIRIVFEKKNKSINKK